MTRSARLLAAAGGLAGASGVALSAYAAHAGGANTATAATFLLMHAPLFVALGLTRAPVALRLAGWAVLAGLVLFCGDLALRELAGTRLFAMAAPAGGTLMIAGWLGLAVAAFVARPHARPTD